MEPIITAGQQWVAKTDDGDVIAVTILGASENQTGAWAVSIAEYRLA